MSEPMAVKVQAEIRIDGIPVGIGILNPVGSKFVVHWNTDAIPKEIRVKLFDEFVDQTQKGVTNE